MIQTRNHTVTSTVLYSDPLLRSPLPVNNYRSVERYNSSSREWSPEEGRMSPSRRTFCLFTTFDLILTFILWVIYTQLIGKKGYVAFKDQIEDYDFRSSLFDTVMIATIRFTSILLAYGLFRICHWWVIAITTSMTCIYLLFKCFYFEFSDAFFGGKNPLSYVLLIVCFILAWIETWFLDFRVIPVERKARQRVRDINRSEDHEPLLNHSRTEGSVISDTGQFYSPLPSPEGSDDETEHSHYKSLPGSTNHSRTDSEYYHNLVDEATVALWDMLHMDGWKLEAGKNLQTGIIHGQYIKKYGKKVFRLQGILPLPPKECWAEMVAGLNDSPRWNPTVIESRSLQSIDDTTEVTYNIAAEAAGGLVSARDFVSIRHWTQKEGVYLSIGVGCKHPDMPVQKKYVRGENGPGGWSFQEVEGEPGHTLYTWIVNSNLKGWLLQAAIDQAMSGVLLEYFKLLLNHIEEYKASS